MLLIEHKGQRPQIAASAYIAPNATIIGDVIIGEESSVWFGAVIRGDTGPIRIGARTSVQDNVVLHVNHRHDTIIGDDVTIGHGAILEGCTIGNQVLIGMNATILDGCQVGEGTIIAAGAVVRERTTIPPHVLAAGVPAKIKTELSAEMQKRLGFASEEYRKYGRIYASDLVKIIETA